MKLLCIKYLFIDDEMSFIEGETYNFHRHPWCGIYKFDDHGCIGFYEDKWQPHFTIIDKAGTTEFKMMGGLNK